MIYFTTLKATNPYFKLIQINSFDFFPKAVITAEIFQSNAQPWRKIRRSTRNPHQELGELAGDFQRIPQMPSPRS